MRLRSLLASVAVSGLFWLIGWVYSPIALALTPITLSDISYHECPAEMAKGTVTAGSSQLAKCYLVTGKAENLSNKLVVNADIFGRIYDAKNEPVFQNRTRLGSIEEVPPGVSNFELRISVPANQPTPLQLKQFKAAGFTGKVRR